MAIGLLLLLPGVAAAQPPNAISITVGGRAETISARDAGLPAPVQAGPALWSIHDEDSIIYLFGTVHLMDGGTDWRSQKVEDAFARSDELWVEVAEGDDPYAMGMSAAPVLQRLGRDTATRLSTRLTPGERRSLGVAASLVGATPQQLDGMKPWLAATVLGAAPLLRAGFNPSMGADAALIRAARTQGKPIRGLETSASQLSILGGLPMAIQMQMLRSTLADVEAAPREMPQILAAWTAGDTRTLERTSVEGMRLGSPLLYRAFMVERNQAWVARIQERLKGKGVTFIAVGTAHLIGPDSVQALLARLGVASQLE